MIKPRKTRVRQSQRKLEGTEIEHFVARDLVKRNIDIGEIVINTHEGIDLYITNGKVINVEVKGEKELEHYTYTVKGVSKEGVRKGRFYLKEEDYMSSEVFAFVVKPVNEKLEWDRNKPMEIWYVDSNHVRNYLKEAGLFRRSKTVKISIDIVKKMPRIKPEELLNRCY